MVDLTYTMPLSSTMMVPVPPKGEFVASVVLIGPEDDPILRVVITLLAPLRKIPSRPERGNYPPRYCLWMVNSTGTCTGMAMACRDTEDDARAVAEQVWRDFRKAGN